jgi:FAD/FMN-containing dehydrogenase
MKGIPVLPDRGVARTQPGVTWGDMDHAAQAFGLAVPGGTDSEVGIAGLWLDLVTADGTLLTASAS